METKDPYKWLISFVKMDRLGAWWDLLKWVVGGGGGIRTHGGLPPTLS